MHNDGFEADMFSGNVGSKQPKQHTTQLDSFNPNNPQLLEEPDARGAGSGDKGGGACGKWCGRFASLMLSHLGTLMIVMFYVVMGGFLFEYLESGNEISGCKTKESKYASKRNEAVDLLYNIAQGDNATLAKAAILTEVEKLARDLYSLSFDPDLNCTSLEYEGGDTVSWNLVNAAYFCVTIVTTIGYGHISPVTQWGQIVCMIYSILGIPLMLLFLTKISEPTAMVFRSFYLNIFCFKCFVKRSKRECAEDEQQQTNWENVEDGEVKKPPAKVSELEVIEDDEDEDEEEEIVNIPITVTLMLLILYILIGAGVFSIWEKDWTLVEGTYFSFITLTTIGFGDYVPGRNGPFDDPSVLTELMVGCVYCIFGLATLSMCINLIQDEIAAKFHWVGLKLGIIRPVVVEDDDDDDDDDSSSDEDDEEEDEDEEEEEKSNNGKKSKMKEERWGESASESRSAGSGRRPLVAGGNSEV